MANLKAPSANGASLDRYKLPYSLRSQGDNLDMGEYWPYMTKSSWAEKGALGIFFIEIGLNLIINALIIACRERTSSSDPDSPKFAKKIFFLTLRRILLHFWDLRKRLQRSQWRQQQHCSHPFHLSPGVLCPEFTIKSREGVIIGQDASLYFSLENSLNV